MGNPSDIRKFFLIRLTILLLGVATAQSAPTHAQTQPNRFWLAGRYDGNRIVVYFDAGAVQWHGRFATSFLEEKRIYSRRLLRVRSEGHFNRLFGLMGRSFPAPGTNRIYRCLD